MKPQQVITVHSLQYLGEHLMLVNTKGGEGLTYVAKWEILACKAANSCSDCHIGPKKSIWSATLTHLCTSLGAGNYWPHKGVEDLQNIPSHNLWELPPIKASMYIALK
ncbi:hypothetical protein Pelo_3410 [Pelomyxa schiedti]|nr:hypothetical protein Pelo_3410 [Pelomyxa schiedti]